MDVLLENFIREELSERLIGRIEATVAEATLNPSIAFREFNENVYDLVFNFEKSEVNVNNVLDTSSSGTENLSIDVFLLAIGAKLNC
ncbi:hypothetical protein BTJ40_20195 [Microbulbifer sp. A4B17]|uniref:hypothetical protein n=1 Tax=Microbulbifer sp. A4B17 TaxID=359370 RepID=UPI000D52CCB1|nr:hypothetical protein [Microbulbifer sp. A4B17]AWF82954.1 hypothetical protein BTJ40_20195 [Microbulbifer sp. A4B17]